jgi:hypothetical protein
MPAMQEKRPTISIVTPPCATLFSFAARPPRKAVCVRARLVVRRLAEQRSEAEEPYTGIFMLCLAK